jgi:hypothetical protein
MHVSASPADQSRPFEHLLPIVQALASGGNAPLQPSMFFRDADGWRCDMERPIDFDLLHRCFDFPATIRLSPGTDSILCTKTWIEIAGPGQTRTQYVSRIDPERVLALLHRLREIRPSSVPNSSMHALYVHDDAGAALGDLQLSQTERESLPQDIRTELAELEALSRDDTSG